MGKYKLAMLYISCIGRVNYVIFWRLDARGLRKQVGNFSLPNKRGRVIRAKHRFLLFKSERISREIKIVLEINANINIKFSQILTD